MLSSNEKWIAGYEGSYSVTMRGDVYSHKHGAKLPLSKSVMTGGYHLVGLYKNGARKNAPVHRLVAETFIPRKNSRLIVNHIDGNKQNNNVSNLEWITMRENTLHAYEKGLCRGNGFKRIVIQMLDGVVVSTYESIGKASAVTGINTTSISMVCNGKRKTAGNYEWRFAD